METSDNFLDSPAIKALGSLFKLTQVFLWDDGYSSDNQQISSFPKHIRFVYDDDDDNDDGGGDEVVKVDVEGKHSSNTGDENSGSLVMEDAEEMSVLGLPLTFQTSKNSNTQTKGIRKVTQHKDQDNKCKLKDLVFVSPKLIEDSQSYAECQDKSINSLDQAEFSCSGSDITDDNVKLASSCDEQKLGYMVDETGNDDIEEHKCEKLPRNLSNEALTVDLLEINCQMENATTLTSCECDLLDYCVEKHPKESDGNLVEHIYTKGPGLDNAMQLDDLDSSICIAKTQTSDMLIDSGNVLDNIPYDNISSSAVCGEWSAFWDSFYMRYYFYNYETQESTWCTPPGMESFVCGDISNVLDKSMTEMNADSTSSHLSEQLDQQELADKMVFDKQTGEKAGSAQQPAIEDLSSGTVMLSDISHAVNILDQHVPDGKCQDEININSLLSTVNHNHHAQNEVEHEDFGGLSIGMFPSKDFDTVGGFSENGSKNFNGNIVARVSDASSLSSAVEAACDDDPIDFERMEELETLTNAVCRQDASGATKQKKKRKNRRQKKSINKNGDHDFQPVDDHYVDITKYWCQRYLLFSKFDDGIKMDEEGWFSVTPEVIAKHHASRSGGGIVIDCFAGVGGNVIQFAKVNKHVIAIDIDPKKIDYAQHNAAIYGVEDRIDFINEDCFSLAPKLKADTVFLSPPWGGPDYLKTKSYNLSMLRPHDGKFLFNTFKVTASFIIMFLPRNVDIVQLAELCLSSDTPWSLEIEKNFLNGKFKAVTAYCSKLDSGFEVKGNSRKIDEAELGFGLLENS